MKDDRRVPKRVSLEGVTCNVQARSREVTTTLNDVSPSGACISVERVGGVTSEEILDAWVHEAPLRVTLESGAGAPPAVLVWARGPRPEERGLRFGLRFVKPIVDFGTLVRQLLRRK